MQKTDTYIDAVRAATTISELNDLFRQLGGAANGTEFMQTFTWRKEEIQRENTPYQSHYAPDAEALFREWQTAIQDMQDHGRQWARGDAEVKRLRGKKVLYYRTQGKTVTEAEAAADDDAEVFDSRLRRNTAEAMLKADYSIRDLLQAKWEFMRSQIATERAADGQTAPHRPTA